MSQWSLAEDVGFEFVVFNSSAVVFVDDLEEGVNVLSFNGNLELGDEVSHFVDGEVTTLVQIEVVEDLSKESRVALGKLKDAGFDFTEEVGDGLLSNLRVLFFRDLPGRFHHANEIFIRGSAHGKVGVVVDEFLGSDNAISVALGSFEV